MMCVTTMCLTGWNFDLKIILNTYIDVTEAVMMFIVTAGDAQSSPGKGNTEDESTSDLESPAPVTSKRGRPRKYLTELDAVEARRRRAREYYHRNSERIMDQQKLYQHLASRSTQSSKASTLLKENWRSTLGCRVNYQTVFFWADGVEYLKRMGNIGVNRQTIFNQKKKTIIEYKYKSRKHEGRFIPNETLTLNYFLHHEENLYNQDSNYSWCWL